MRVHNTSVNIVWSTLLTAAQHYCLLYRDDDKSLARPGRKQATATEDFDLMEYITMCLDSTNKVEHCYVRHNWFIVLNCGLHVSTYTQVIFRPSYTGESIKHVAHDLK